MIELDYGTLLSPDPISLSIGTIVKPTLRDISKLSFSKFNIYESFIKMTPELYYKEVLHENGGIQKWESFDESYRDEITLFDIIKSEPVLQQSYTDVLNFFFLENVVFMEKSFVIFRREVDFSKQIDAKKDVCGIISNSKTFMQVLEIIQQTCCIYEKPKKKEEVKFKNKLAKKIYEKMLKAKEEQERLKSKQVNKDLSIPNIISAVSNKHSSLNPINIWDLTVFQLIDSFNRLRTNAVYDINSLRISVWGDEKKKFDETLWYKYKDENHDNND